MVSLKRFFLFLSFVFLIVGCGGKSPEVIKTGEHSKTVKTFHSNGQLETVVNYSNGKPYGTAEVYGANGKLRAVSNWIGGVRSGETRTYWESGRIATIENYYLGKPSGTMEGFYDREFVESKYASNKRFYCKFDYTTGLKVAATFNKYGQKEVVSYKYGHYEWKWKKYAGTWKGEGAGWQSPMYKGRTDMFAGYAVVFAKRARTIEI